MTPANKKPSSDLTKTVSMESAFGVVSLPQRSDLECEKSPLDGFLSLALNKPMMDCSGIIQKAKTKKTFIMAILPTVGDGIFRGWVPPPLRFL